MKKKKLIILLAVIVILGTIILSAVASGTSKMSKAAEIHKNNKDKPEEVVAIVNGKEIKSKNVKAIKEAQEIMNINKSEKEIIETIIIDHLLLKESEKHNITVTDEEVNNIIEFQKEALSNNKETYSELTDYVKALDMTEEEYWQMLRPIYKKRAILGKHKQLLKEEFINSNKNSLNKNTNINNLFEEYYIEYKGNLLKNADVKILY